MDKIKVNDMSFKLSAERPYKLRVRGNKYSNGTNYQVQEDIDLDMSDLTLEQIGVIAGFLDAVFDRANLNSITGAEILPLEDKPGLEW